MSYTFSRLSAAAVVLLAPVAFSAAAHGAEPAPDLGYARNGGVTIQRPDLGYARNGGVAIQRADLGYARNGGVTIQRPDLGYARNGGVGYQAPDVGRARNEVAVPATEPSPGAPVDTGVDAETWVLVGATGAVVVGLGVAGGMFVRRRHQHLPHPA